MASTTQFPEIFAALAKPFGRDEQKSREGGGGRKLDYITARTAMKRLDEVIGPENWQDDYYEVCNVLFCRITITLPDGRIVAKSDAGGFKEMTERGKVDEENTDKTGPSDAFKRAAAKFGVGRYLYKDGSVDYDQPYKPDLTRPKDEPAVETQGGRAFLEYAQEQVRAANSVWAMAGWKSPLCTNAWQMITHLAKHFNLFPPGTKASKADVMAAIESLDVDAVKLEVERYLKVTLPNRAKEAEEMASDTFEDGRE